MRSFAATAATLFVLLFGAHVARLLVEGSGPLRDPVFVISTLATLAMAAWGLATLRRKDGSGN